MPRGRPKILSNYEKTKVKKMREILAEQNISRFDAMNDSNLLKVLYIDTSGKVYVSLQYHDDTLNRISESVSGLIN